MSTSNIPELDLFRNYLLEDVGITHIRYVNGMCNQLKNYLQYLIDKGLSIEESEYSTLMNFIGSLQSKGVSRSQINRHLQIISHYYRFKDLPNIAETTRIRGVVKTQPQNLLTAEDLDSIYDNYISKDHITTPYKQSCFHHSNRLILGLIIYQAVDMRELLQLEVGHLKLEQGEIYLGEYRYKRSRYIPLKANQILSLHSYLIDTYPSIRDQESDLLFSPQADNYNRLHHQFKILSKQVKEQTKEHLNIDIGKLSQLRHSRIAVWTEEYNIMKAQYLAGFKRVMSAERYKQASLKDLREQLEEHHPLK